MDHVPGSESASAPAWHAMPCPQVIDRLQSDGGRGLGQAAAAARLAAGGRNRLPAPQPDAPVVVLLRQLRSPLVYVLLLAAGLALLLGHVTDAGFIGVVLLVNSLLGAWQELQAERQSANLQGLLRVRATVQRDGSARQVDAEELVAGDVVLLESGDRVPADLRLLEARGLEVDASLLTGESLPVLCDAAGTLRRGRRCRRTGSTARTPGRWWSAAGAAASSSPPACRPRSVASRGPWSRPSPASRRSPPAWSASAGRSPGSCWSLPC